MNEVACACGWLYISIAGERGVGCRSRARVVYYEYVAVGGRCACMVECPLSYSCHTTTSVQAPSETAVRVMVEIPVCVSVGGGYLPLGDKKKGLIA